MPRITTSTIGNRSTRSAFSTLLQGVHSTTRTEKVAAVSARMIR